MKIMSVILTPLRYIRIKYPDKRILEVFFPMIFATGFLIVDFFTAGGLNVIGERGLVDKFSSLIQILSGFYIAALAAIATFQNSTIDDVMSGSPPTIVEPDSNGFFGVVELTRRRFLSYMFGYLAFISIGLFFLGVVVELIAPILKIVIPGYIDYFQSFFVFVYTYVFFSMMLTTFLGLYFLSYRIHLVENKRSGG